MAFLAKCEQCGRFIGYANYVTYTPYGGCLDVDPPDPAFECLKCWDGQEEKWRRLTYNISWTKPMIVRNHQREQYIPSIEDKQCNPAD